MRWVSIRTAAGHRFPWRSHSPRRWRGPRIADGSIASIDDPVTKYLPGLKGSAYDGVTVRHILTMTSGVKWNEDYVDSRSDVNSFSGATDESRGSRLVTYMSKLPRARDASKFEPQANRTQPDLDLKKSSTERRWMNRSGMYAAATPSV